MMRYVLKRAGGYGFKRPVFADAVSETYGIRREGKDIVGSCSGEMTRHVIMMSGWLKSGKDTAGEYLCARYGFRRLAFADALKDEVSETYGIPRELLDRQEGKDAACGGSGETVRDVLIRHGQWRRSQDSMYWIRKVLAETRSKERIVITDWRFPDEFEMVSRHSHVETWRVQRWARPPKDDPSETALDSMTFDFTLDNTGTVAQLHARIDTRMARK